MQYRKLNELKKLPNNPRIIRDKQFKTLCDSIRDNPKYFEARPVILSNRTGELVIIAGNQRYEAAKSLKLKEVPTFLIEGLDEAKEREIIIRDNISNGEFDFDELANSWSDLPLVEWGVDLPEDWLKSDAEPADAEPQMDKAAELNKIWKVKTGDLWQIGEHRLLCGDSTKKEDVARVMGGEKANLLFTSPPYWVGMDYETQKSEQEIDEFIHACSRTFTEFISVDNGRIVINTGTAAIHRIEKKRKVEVLPLIFKWQMELRQSGWLARHYRIWAKSGGFAGGVVSPKVDAVDQHWETITTFSAETEEQQYIGTYWCPAGLQRGQEKVGEKWAQQGIWTDIQGDKSAGGTHVAAFPLELPERNIRLYSKDSEIVFEPFLGSGTTMVACQNLNRKCRGIEINPDYCAVILQRMHDAFPNIEIKRLP